jgi:hypothetical protein
MKKIIIIIIALLVLLISGFLLIKSRLTTTEEAVETIPTPTIALPTVSDNIQIDLIARSDNQAVTIKIKGLTSDIESIEYELTYITGAGLPRGVLGKIKLTGEKEVTRDDVVLGTCSSGKCAYDTGVKEVNLSLKFNTPQGNKIFQKTYSL